MSRSPLDGVGSNILSAPRDASKSDVAARVETLMDWPLSSPMASVFSINIGKGIMFLGPRLPPIVDRTGRTSPNRAVLRAQALRQLGVHIRNVQRARRP